MSKTVAVTGAGGFVGFRLVGELARRGWHVYAVTSHPENIPKTSRITPIGCSWTVAGIEEAFTQAQNADLWVHAAARVDFSNRNLLALYHDNTLLTERLAFHIFRLSAVTCLVYLSSVSVYRNGQELSTEVEPQPEIHYGLSKLLGERLCLAHLGKRCLVYRLAGVWGKERSPKLFINRCLQQAEAGQSLTVTGHGQAKRNYLWVGDVPKIIVLAFTKNWHGVRLAAGPEPISIRDMVTAIGGRFGVPVRFEEKDVNQPEHDVLVKMSPGLQTTPFFEALDVETGRRL